MRKSARPEGPSPLCVRANLTISLGRRQAKLTGKGSKLRLVIRDLFGIVAFYRSLPQRLGGLGRKEVLGHLHRVLLAQGLSLQVIAGPIDFGTVGRRGPTGLLAWIVRFG